MHISLKYLIPPNQGQNSPLPLTLLHHPHLYWHPRHPDHLPLTCQPQPQPQSSLADLVSLDSL